MKMNDFISKRFIGLALSVILLSASGSLTYAATESDGHGSHEDHQQEVMGSKGGRLLTDGNVTVELAIIEDEDSPEYRAWITRDGSPLNDKNLRLAVEVTRLEGKVDRFVFQQVNGYWVSDAVVAEPHSFDVNVSLILAGQTHEWQFESYEGRAEIASDIARQSGIEVVRAAPGNINRTLPVYGKVVSDSGLISHVRARFPGTITRVIVNIGDLVEKGDLLAEVESNDSLKRYSLRAPLAGMVTARHATPGEVTEEQALFTVANFDQVWAEFQIFPGQVRRVQTGQKVTVSVESERAESTIKHLIPSNSGQPFVLARAPIDNTNGRWTPGLLVVGKVSVDTFEAQLVVNNRAIQSQGDERVVFIRVGNSYEARPLKLGRSDGRFTEVLGGLAVGDEYVVENSYLIKADLEKSGASHEH